MIASGPEACVFIRLLGVVQEVMHVRGAHERRCECQLPCPQCTLSNWAASPAIATFFCL